MSSINKSTLSKILKKFNMVDTKPMKIHMHTSTSLDKDENGKNVDQMVY